MCQLRSPYQLNGQVFDFIYHNSALPPDEHGEDDNLDFISELPFFSEENWNQMMVSLKDIQVQLLKEWLSKFFSYFLPFWIFTEKNKLSELLLLP